MCAADPRHAQRQRDEPEVARVPQCGEVPLPEVWHRSGSPGNTRVPEGCGPAVRQVLVQHVYFVLFTFLYIRSGWQALHKVFSSVLDIVGDFFG